MAPLQVVVAEIEQLTPSIRKFVLVPNDGRELPAWSPGAHLIFHLPGGLKNAYSLAGDYRNRRRYVTAVLREASGKGGSRYMHDELNVGDALEVDEPQNNFAVHASATRHLLIAGGIGITPLLAMGYQLRDAGADYHLYYCTKLAAETAFLAEVRELFADRVTFHHDAGDPTRGLNLVEALRKQREGEHLYICGPSGLLTAARQAAQHWAEGTVHFELFSSSRSGAEITSLIHEAGDGAFSVYCRQSDKTFTVPREKTILQVLLDNGIDVAFACEEGWCGACKVDLIEGRVDHRDECLSESERKHCLQPCISRAAAGERLLALDI